MIDFGKIKNFNQIEINGLFSTSCTNGDVDTIEYLLTSKEVPFKVDLVENQHLYFGIAVDFRQKEVLDYLFKLPAFKDGEKYQYCIQKYFESACEGGWMDTIKYIFTTPELKEKINVHAQDEFALYLSALNNRVQVVHFLLNSELLNDHANIHGDNDCCFRTAVEENSLDVVKYLIFDFKIKKTYAIKKFLIDEGYKEMDEWFHLRKLHKTLTDEVIVLSAKKGSSRNKI